LRPGDSYATTLPPVDGGRLRPFLEPVTVVGTLLSILAGLVSFISGDSDVVLGVVVGLSVQAIALLVQIILRLEANVARLGRSGALLAKIESVPWLPDRVDIFCTDIATIEEKYPNTLVPGALQRVLDGLEVRLNELERGHLYVDSYDPGLKLELLKQSPSILRTTSLQPQDLVWHRSDVGRRYWAAQLDALARGWEIQRIFIYDTWSGDLDSLAGERKSAGVRVKRILTGELPSGLLVDVTTWGNTHVYEWRVRAEGTTTLDRFSVNEVDIRRCGDLFRRIDDLAEAF
jgi:hypothetical protein